MYLKAKQLLVDRREGLEAVADALVLKETLRGEDLAEIATVSTRRKIAVGPPSAA